MFTGASSPWYRSPVRSCNTSKRYSTRPVQCRTNICYFIWLQQWIGLVNHQELCVNLFTGASSPRYRSRPILSCNTSKRYSTRLVQCRTNFCYFIWLRQWIGLVNHQELGVNMFTGASSPRYRRPVPSCNTSKRYITRLVQCRTNICYFIWLQQWIGLVHHQELGVNYERPRLRFFVAFARFCFRASSAR